METCLPLEWWSQSPWQQELNGSIKPCCWEAEEEEVTDTDMWFNWVIIRTCGRCLENFNLSGLLRLELFQQHMDVVIFIVSLEWSRKKHQIKQTHRQFKQFVLFDKCDQSSRISFTCFQITGIILEQLNFPCFASCHSEKRRKISQ